MTDPKIKIGTSGYSYPGPAPKGWAGTFYPVQGRRFDALEYYSRFFDVVEINSSFYRPPAPAMAEAWVAKTPDDFEFAVKLWQKFTHPRKIGGDGAKTEWEPVTKDDLDLFKTGLLPLAQSGKLGALLLQYPAGFYCTPENMEKLGETLRSFAEYPKVVEVRHKSWSDRIEETKALLQEHNASLALIDEPKFASSIRQRFEAVGDMLYFRAHGRNAQSWWQHQEGWERYDYLYSWQEIKRLGEKLKSVSEARPNLKKAVVFFNNHARAQAVANALMLAHEMGLPLKARPSESLVQQFPELSNLTASPTAPERPT